MAHYCAAATGSPVRSEWSIIPPPLTPSCWTGTLQSISGQRDVAQRYLIDMSEHQLYFYAQAGVTLFWDIHDDVFDDELVAELPERVLPVSTTASRDLAALFDKVVEKIKRLLVPGTRRKMDAIAKARSLAVLQGAVNRNYEQPSGRELRKICKRLAGGEPWTTVFPGVAPINITGEADGPNISLQLTKNEGMPVQLLKKGEGKAVETGYPDDVVEIVKANAHDLKPVEAQWRCETE